MKLAYFLCVAFVNGVAVAFLTDTTILPMSQSHVTSQATTQQGSTRVGQTTATLSVSSGTTSYVQSQKATTTNAPMTMNTAGTTGRSTIGDPNIVFPQPRRYYICMKSGLTWVSPTCSNPDEVLAIQSVKIGYLALGTNCNEDSNVTGCEQDHTHTQFVGDGQSYGDIFNMDGHKPNRFQIAPDGAFGDCNDGRNRTVGDYSVINYDCINPSDVATMCGSDRHTNSTIYVWSDRYPEHGGLGDQCQCKIDTTASGIIVQMYDNRIDNTQSLNMVDGKGTTLATWTRDTMFNKLTTSNIKLNGKTLTLRWDGGNETLGTKKGQFWIRLAAYDKSPLTIQCFGKGPSSSRVTQTDDIFSAEAKRVLQCSDKFGSPFLSLRCPNNQVIGLRYIKVGFLKNGTNCTNAYPNSTNVCEQDHTTYQWLGTEGNPDDKGDIGISGTDSNQHPISNVGIPGSCIQRSAEGLPVSKTADYIAAYYDCVDTTEITSMCQPSIRQGNIVYIWNEGYPYLGDFKQRTCQCFINSTSNKIVVQTYDNRLVCSQSLTLRQDNKTDLLSWHCDEKMNRIQTVIVRTDGRPMTLDWMSPNETSRAETDKTGRFWIRIRAYNDTEADLSIQCFEPVLPTTTTTSTTTTTTNTTVAPTTSSSLHQNSNVVMSVTATGRPSTNAPSKTNTSAETQDESKYCIPKYLVYVVCGGFGGILLIFITGCIVMSRRTGSSELKKRLDNLEMGMIPNRTKGDFQDRQDGPYPQTRHRPEERAKKIEAKYGRQTSNDIGEKMSRPGSAMSRTSRPRTSDTQDDEYKRPSGGHRKPRHTDSHDENSKTPSSGNRKGSRPSDSQEEESRRSSSSNRKGRSSDRHDEEGRKPSSGNQRHRSSDSKSEDARREPSSDERKTDRKDKERKRSDAHTNKGFEDESSNTDARKN